MKPGRWTHALALVTLFTAAASAGAAAAPASPAGKPPPAVDPAAIDALERMGSFLRAQKSLALEADTTTDEVLDSGQKIQLDEHSKVTLRRPDRMRATVSSDRKTRELYYDGRSFTVFGPRTGYYATVAAPPTLGELARVLSRRFGLALPVADLFFWGTDRGGEKAIQAASHVGTTSFDGVTTDHFAFRQRDVDWQIWIQRGDTPLPRKLVITTKNEPGQPQHTVLMRWDLTAPATDRQFAFTPPKDARRIELQPLDARSAPRQGRAARQRR